MSNKTHSITRSIGIDMGHRVTFHGSKCKNLHGHRYEVLATCEGPLFTEGEQAGMIIDFGFLKEEMMNEIDTPCDHGTCLWIDDPFVEQFLEGKTSFDRDFIKGEIKDNGYWTGAGVFGKLYLVPFVPTAENLARHWFERLESRVVERTIGNATLLKVKVYETPNCSAEYSK